MEIKKVLKRVDKSGELKYLIVPKGSDIEAGDYVRIEKIKYKEVDDDR